MADFERKADGRRMRAGITLSSVTAVKEKRGFGAAVRLAKTLGAAHIVFVVSTSSFGQQVPPSPAVRGFGDSKFWVTVEDMTYVIGSTQDKIVVPKGFVTDFASIPQPLWSLGLSPFGQYSRAAVIHDFLYWTQVCSRAQADRLLVIAMKESQVGTLDEVAIYQGVHKFGRGPWRSNATERRAELPRVLPEQFLRPDDPNVSWPDYRRSLVVQGVKDPPFEQSPAYCSYGNSTTVP